jgi:nicotinate-nucleotide adenylyltransferase
MTLARIGLMGGTFDPIHFGHLVLAEQARETLGLERVLFVTAGNPPHKPDSAVTDAAHRLKMTELAIEGNPFFEAPRIEVEREGPSYTVDTIRGILEGNPGSELFLLVGSDEAENFMTWRSPREIVGMATLVVANRPGVEVSSALSRMPEDVRSRAIELKMPGVDISSTDIRDRVRAGRSIKYLVPRAVEDYIAREGLYRG